MKSRNDDMAPVPVQVSEKEMKDARELTDEELEGVAGGQVVYGLRRDLGEFEIKGSVPIIRPF